MQCFVTSSLLALKDETSSIIWYGSVQQDMQSAGLLVQSYKPNTKFHHHATRKLLIIRFSSRLASRSRIVARLSRTFFPRHSAI